MTLKDQLGTLVMVSLDTVPADQTPLVKDVISANLVSLTFRDVKVFSVLNNKFLLPRQEYRILRIAI